MVFNWLEMRFAVQVPLLSICFSLGASGGKYLGNHTHPANFN
jgi:hypothetical protein